MEATSDIFRVSSATRAEQGGITGLWSKAVGWSKAKLQRHQVVQRLLSAIKSGDTTAVLEALTDNSTLLADYRFAYDGDTVRTLELTSGLYWQHNTQHKTSQNEWASSVCSDENIAYVFT